MSSENNPGDSSSNPIGNSADTSQQNWLGLDQLDAGGETLKAKQWTTKRRLVDDSSHHGNIHTGRKETVELDKSDTLAGEVLQAQTIQTGSSQVLQEAEIEQSTVVNRSRPDTEEQNREEQGPQSAYDQSRTDEVETVVAKGGGADPLVFEERFETDADDRSSRRDQDESSATQQTVSPQTVTELVEESSPEPASTPETTPAVPSPGTSPLATSPSATPVIPGPVTSTPPQPLPEEEESEETIEIIPVESSASAPTLNAVDSHGLEDTAIALDLSSSLTDTDGSESLSITINGVPAGATLSAGQDLGNGTWELTSNELTDLTLSPPTNSDEDFSLTITTTSTESHGGATQSVSEVIDVFLEAVNDDPIAVADAYQNTEHLNSENPGNQTDGAPSGTRVIGIYTQGSDENLLDGKDDLLTLNDHNYFEHNSLGHTGYNYMGGNNWFADNDISLSGLRGGIITFEDGTQGIIDTSSNGVTRDRDGDGTVDYEENAYIYYNAYEPLGDLETLEDRTLTISPDTLLVNDSDVDSNSLSITDVANATNGTVALNEDGTITFEPDTSFSGEATFTYTVDDSQGGSSSATVTLNIQAVVDNPEITFTTASGDEDSSIALNIDVALSDTDGSETLSQILVEGVPHDATLSTGQQNNDGSWTLNQDELEGLTVTPGPNNNQDFTLQISTTATESNGDVATTTIELPVTVNAVNDAPNAVDDRENGILDSDNPGSQTDGAASGTRVTGIYANSSDANLLEGKSELTTLSDHSYFEHGSLGHTGYNYMGGHDWFADNDISLSELRGGIITFEDGTQGIIDTSSNGITRDRDGDGTTDYEENAYIYYNAYEVAGELETQEDTPLTISQEVLLANDTDVDGDTLSITAVSSEVLDNDGNIIGTAEQDNAGNIIFTPGNTLDSLADGESKNVNLTYTVSDGQGGTDTANATVLISGTNDAPVITNVQTLDINEESMEGFSGYGETWEGDVYSVVTQAEMLEHLGITDVDSDTFSVSLADAEVAWHDGIQANDSVFNSDTLSAESARGDESVVQVTQNFLDNYPNVDAEVGDFYFDHVDFDSLSEGEIANINFSVQVSDGETTSEPSNFEIVVTGSNDAPVVSGTVILPGGEEDNAQSFTASDLLATTSDTDTNDSLSVTNVTVDPEQGVLTSYPDGTFTFTPKDNFNGEVTINYEVTDGIEIIPATASLELASVNDTPIAVADLSSDQQAQLSGNNTSLITDSSIIQDNSEPYTVSLDITPAEQDYGYIISNGGQTGAASGFFVTRGVYGKDNSVYQVGVADENQSIVFQGGQAENGQESNLTFSYDGQDLTVYQDGVNITATGTISTGAGRDLPMQNVTIGAPSNIPTSYEFQGETDNVQIYDSSLSASEVGQIQDGEIPAPDGLLAHYSFEGDTPLTDQSGNGHDLQANGDIQFSETPVVGLSTEEDTPLTISQDILLANDTDADGDTLSITAVSSEVLDNDGNIIGTAEQDSAGNIVFTPGNTLDSLADGESKNVNFTYTVSDGQGGTDTANASITVQGTDNDLTYVSETAGYRNVVGTYQIDEDGNPVSGTVVIDDQNGMAGGTHLADLEPGNYEFFIIANGAGEINDDSVISFDNSGDQPVLLINDEPASHPVYYTEPTFNSDGKDHFQFESDGEGGTYINIEDLPDLGDADFGDVVLHTNFEMDDRTAVGSLSDSDQTTNSVDDIVSTSDTILLGSESSVISAAAITATATDTAIQDFNDANISDLSLSIPSITIPGEEKDETSDIQEMETVPAEEQVTAVQDQSETPDATETESQPQTDVLADDDLATSLPSESLSNLFDEPVDEPTSDSAETSENETQSSSTQTEEAPVTNVAESPVAETPITSPTATDPVEQESVEDVEAISSETDIEEESEATDLSTDDLRIDLASDDDSETTESEAEENDLDQFSATSDNTAQTEDSSTLDSFSASDSSTANTEDLASVEEIDTAEADVQNQEDDAGLNDVDAIQEDLSQEPEQVDPNGAG